MKKELTKHSFAQAVGAVSVAATLLLNPDSSLTPTPIPVLHTAPEPVKAPSSYLGRLGTELVEGLQSARFTFVNDAYAQVPTICYEDEIFCVAHELICPIVCDGGLTPTPAPTAAPDPTLDPALPSEEKGRAYIIYGQPKWTEGTTTY